jgi:TonB family protein
MENTKVETAMAQTVCFPAIGGKSPILNFSAKYLRSAFYLTNAFIFLVIFGVFGYVKYSQWQYQKKLKQLGETLGKKVISVTYAQLGPPPSLLGNEGMATPTVSGARAAAPSVGVPKPVPDALAQQETSPDQTTISGTSVLEGAGTGEATNIVVESLPPIDAYIPHEVEPKFTFKPALEYPEAARQFDMSGTAFIKAFIDADGEIKRIVVVKGTGYPILDSAAVNYLARCKFSPALQAHKPVGVWIGQSIDFKLKGG